ncbi:MAG: BsaA family SipW-dependent biofilm matrix protein [Candidatus Saccharibacteria bacterium]|nr:BsaA family SipW-dependent biofilm matrix protein [Candidatus Saccharibacteria bacterium]
MKKKRVLAFIALTALVATVGGTVAYYSNVFEFDNNFKLGSAVTEYVETFESPDNWKSCDTTPKTLVITNKSNTPVAARFKIEEYWKKAGSTSTGHDSDLSSTYMDEKVAIINFQNEGDWEKKGDWYYFKRTLDEGESTTSLLESVSFNCNVNFAGDVVYSEDGKTGYSTTNDYQNAKYHLYITAQTVEESHRLEAWGQ